METFSSTAGNANVVLFNQRIALEFRARVFQSARARTFFPRVGVLFPSERCGKTGGYCRLWVRTIASPQMIQRHDFFPGLRRAPAMYEAILRKYGQNLYGENLYRVIWGPAPAISSAATGLSRTNSPIIGNRSTVAARNGFLRNGFQLRRTELRRHGMKKHCRPKVSIRSVLFRRTENSNLLLFFLPARGPQDMFHLSPERLIFRRGLFLWAERSPAGIFASISVRKRKQSKNFRMRHLTRCGKVFSIPGQALRWVAQATTPTRMP